MRESAFRWWNETISPDREALSLPELQTPSEMAFIWPQISTIIQSLLDPLIEDEKPYWQSVTDIIARILPGTEIPSPTDKFPEFIEFLYANRNEIQPLSVKTLERYVDTFCKDGEEAQFFNSKFVTAAAQPPVIINAFLHFHETKQEKWMKYISCHGSVERVFDLFITFLNQFQADGKYISDENYDIRFLLELATFLTRLLVEIDDSLTLSNDVISNFYSRLLKHIKYSNNEHSVTFLRCAIEINNRWLPNVSEKERFSRITTLIASTQSPRIVRPIVLKYALMQVENGYLPAEKLVNVLLKQTLNTVNEMEVMEKIALIADEETRLHIIKFFARRMATNKVMMRCAANILANLLKISDGDQKIMGWFSLFTNSLFCFFKIAYARHKYMRRILLLCEVLSAEYFDDVEWVRNLFIEAANCAYAVGRKLDFLKSYFPITKATNASNFETLLSKLSNYSGKLKTFPFKPNGYFLLENGRYRNKVKLPKEVDDKSIDASLKGIGLTPASVKYVYENFEAGPVDQQGCIFELEDFVEREQEKADSLQVQRDTKSFSLKVFPKNTNDLDLVGLKVLISENEQKIYEYQNSVLTDYIKIALDIVSAISIHPHLFANQKLLVRNLSDDYSSAPIINQLKRERERLIVKAQYKLGELKMRRVQASQVSDLRNNISNASTNLITSIQYSPPSSNEANISQYLAQHPLQFNEDLRAVHGAFQKNPVELTLNVFAATKLIMSKLKFQLDSNRQVISDSLHRISFDKAYTHESDLCKYQKFNNEFLANTSSLLQTPISELKLRPEIVKKLSKYPTLGAFCSKMPFTCGIISFINNPLDIGFIIYRVLYALPSVIGVESLTQEELSRFLLGVLSVDPPSNAVAIAVFLDRFVQSISSLPLCIAFDTYKKAIFLVVDEKGVRDEQHDNDSESSIALSPDISLSLQRACEQSEE